MGHPALPDIEKQSPDTPPTTTSTTTADDDSATASWLTIIQYAVIGHLGLLIVLLHIWAPSSALLERSLANLFKQHKPPFLAYSSGTEQYEKPTGLEVVAVVPVRNRSRTEILHRYLRRNLVQNDGVVDHLVFIPETTTSAAAAEEDHPQWLIQPWNLFRPGVLYLQIDGDIVFMEDHTIPTVVKTKLDYPHSVMVSANVINEDVMAPLYNRLYFAASAPAPAGKEVSTTNVAKAQLQHELFLDHLHQGPESLRHYKFPLWVNPPSPVRPIFAAFWGDDARAVWDYCNKTLDDMSMAKSGTSGHGHDHERIIIDGKGLAARYSAEAGLAGLDATDVLERYRAFARLRTGHDVMDSSEQSL